MTSSQRHPPLLPLSRVLGTLIPLAAAIAALASPLPAQAIPPWWHVLPGSGYGAFGDGSNYGNPGPDPCGGGFPQSPNDIFNNNSTGGPAGAGNPIDTLGGSPQLIITDAEIPANGPVPMAVVRSYHNGGLSPAHWRGEGLLGPTWFMNWEEHLSIEGAGLETNQGDPMAFAAGSAIWIETAEGGIVSDDDEIIVHVDPLGVRTRHAYFETTGEGDVYHPVLVPELGRGRLVDTGDEYLLELADGTIKTFNRRGHLTRIEDPQGRAVNLTWETHNDSNLYLYLPVDGYGVESTYNDRVMGSLCHTLRGVSNMAGHRAAWLGGSAGDPITIHVQKEVLAAIQVEGDSRSLVLAYHDAPGSDVAILNETSAAQATRLSSFANWGGVTRGGSSVNTEELIRQLYLDSFGTRCRVARIDLHDNGNFVRTMAEYGHSSAEDDDATLGEWPNGYGVELDDNEEDTLIIACQRLIHVDWWPEYPNGDPGDPGVTDISTRWEQAYVYGTASLTNPEATVDLSHDDFEHHRLGEGDNITTLGHIWQARTVDSVRETHVVTAYRHPIIVDLFDTFHDTGLGARVLLEFKRDPNDPEEDLFQAYQFSLGSGVTVYRGDDEISDGRTDVYRADADEGGGIDSMSVFDENGAWIRHINYEHEDIDAQSDHLTHGITREVRREDSNSTYDNFEREMTYHHANTSTMADWWIHGRLEEAEEFHPEGSTDPVRLMEVEYSASSHAPSRIVRFDGTETVFTYNSDRTVDDVTVRRVDSTDETLQTEFTYTTTPPGLIETVTDPLGITTTFSHDATTGLLTRVEGQFNRYIRRYYDPGLTTAIDPLGRVFAIEEGYVDSSVDVPERRTLFTCGFDANPTLVTQITAQNLVDAGAEDRVTHLGYDSEERLSYVIDPAGEGTIYGRNCLGQVTSVEAADGSEWITTHDSWGRALSMEDPLGRVNSWDQDFADRVTRVMRPDGVYSDITYGRCGGCSSATAFSGVGRVDLYQALNPQSPSPEFDTLLRSVLIDRDDLGLPTLTTWNDDLDDEWGENVAQAYDDINVSISGHQWQRVMTAIEDQLLDYGDGAVHFDHDEWGRVTETTEPDGATVGYEYDDYGRITRVIDPDGNVTEYGWDTDGTLERVSNGFGQETLYGYDEDSGRLETVVHANGTSISLAYDGWGQLHEITHWDAEVPPNIIAQRTCEYGLTGLPATVEFEDGRWIALEHDGIGQLVRETWHAADDSELWSRLYTYDLAGNCTEVELVRGDRSSPDDTETTEFEIGTLDQVLSDGSATYTYDAFGNLTSIQTSSELEWQFTYDPRTDALQRAELIDLEDPLTPLRHAEMLSDPLGRRILRRSLDGTLTRTFFDGFNPLLEREIHPTRLQVYDDFSRPLADHYWNTPTPEELGHWAPCEAYAGGLPDPPYPSSWNGYYRLDGDPYHAPQNMVPIYGSGPSEDPELPHSPPMFSSIMAPVEDPFVWSGVDTNQLDYTFRLVFGMRDLDDDMIHDSGTDDMWAVSLDFLGSGGTYDPITEQWSIQRWDPSDDGWTDEITPYQRPTGVTGHDPNALFMAVQLDSDVPGVDGSRVTVCEVISGEWQAIAPLTTDFAEVIHAGHVGFQAEMPF
ncbi:RHS repeat protein, partial [Candidatus Sumerlaeota bacterium]|nr:RHS repeat protein [Candidatus Sumerlaeota bacterium]